MAATHKKKRAKATKKAAKKAPGKPKKKAPSRTAIKTSGKTAPRRPGKRKAPAAKPRLGMMAPAAVGAPLAAAVGGAPAVGAPKDDALQAMEDSIAGLNDAEGLLDAADNADPPPSDRDHNSLVRKMGQINQERTRQALLRDELRAAATVVAPPTPDSGKDLAAALDKLAKMRQATDQVTLLLNLASQAVSSFQAHRLEVASRTTA
jgi:hypothetical protein